MPSIAMTVNGKAVSVDAEPHTLVVEALREQLGLTGTHVGCDTSQCGACVVHVDGNSVKSCTLLALQCEGKSVTTIEGLSEGRDMHPVQEAFLETGALQCGDCTGGMILTAVALLEQHARPTDAQIVAEMNGNICRCNGYSKIFDAIRRAGEKMEGPS